MLAEAAVKTKMTRYIFISGGVISGLGKGVATASIAFLLKSAGFKVNIVKIDMYLNIDAGTMNPLEHGEVFVASDGLETDQDLGNYERFLGRRLGRKNYLTAGQLYQRILEKERALKYDGICVEAYHEVPRETIKFLRRAAKNSDFLLVELGGTVGEYQNVLFFEAARRLKIKQPNNVFFIHLVYLMTPSFLGEMKTKPAQQSIFELNRLGISPDFLVCRGEKLPDKRRIKKLALAAALDREFIFSAPDTSPVYRVPLILQEQGFLAEFFKKVDRPVKKPTLLAHRQELVKWQRLIKKIDSASKEVRIAICGKYYLSGNFSLKDAYVSVVESLKIAAWHQGINPEIVWVDAEKVEKEGPEKFLRSVAGVIVPGGFGGRGVEGKIEVIRWVRENKIPYLGLCYGMQLAAVEFARNVAGLKKAHSTEINPQTPYPVIHIMPDQEKKLLSRQYGATMRLGNWPCRLKKGSLTRKAYQKSLIYERHRHRYEFNNQYRKKLKKAGLVISGVTPDFALVEIIELPKSVHPFFVATQFHPEFTTRFLSPNPLFLAFVKAAGKYSVK